MERLPFMVPLNFFIPTPPPSGPPPASCDWPCACRSPGPLRPAVWGRGPLGRVSAGGGGKSSGVRPAALSQPPPPRRAEVPGRDPAGNHRCTPEAECRAGPTVGPAQGRRGRMVRGGGFLNQDGGGGAADGCQGRRGGRHRPLLRSDLRSHSQFDQKGVTILYI